MWSAWCAHCHADDGTGTVQEPTITVTPMDFTECRVTTPEPNADWARAIAKGGPGVGLSSEMPGFEDSLTSEQITGFVAHIRGFCRERGWPMGNLNAAIKYTTYANETTARIVSLGLEAVIPNGSEEKGLGHGTFIFEPFVTAGATVRGWYVQAQAKVELPVDLVKAGRAYIYNLSLGRDTSAAPNTWTFGVELNGENHEVALTPQLRKGLTRTGALAGSLGVMIPLNEREERGVRWVGYLRWEYLEPVRARR